MPQLWTRAAIIGSAAAALSACATPQYPTAEGQTARAPLTMPTPNFPIVAEAAPVATAETAPAAAPSGAVVQSQTLAPPPAAVASQSLAPITPPAPVTRTVTVTAGKVVDAEGKPQTYEVQPGDTLYAIARKLGTTVDRLAADNAIASPSSLRPGQVLNGPSVRTKAYVVESGDTMFAIARRFSTSAQGLAAANEVDLDAPIRVGQRLLLPSGFRDIGPSTRTVTVTLPQPAYQPPVQLAAQTVASPVQAPPLALRPAITPTVQTPAPRPYTPPVTTPVPPPPAPPVARPYTPPATTTPAVTARPYTPSTPQGGIIATNAPPTDNEVSAAAAGRFVWPVMGEVVSAFGPKGTGQRNDGLNIKAPPGTMVRSAANGEVVYAGDQVPGFGNLVLVKHADGWVTAYAHLARIDVKMRDAVMQGQQIGQVGSTGGVGDPQLHFEVRYAPSPKDKARPVDPQLVLPRA